MKISTNIFKSALNLAKFMRYSAFNGRVLSSFAKCNNLEELKQKLYLFCENNRYCFFSIFNIDKKSLKLTTLISSGSKIDEDDKLHNFWNCLAYETNKFETDLYLKGRRQPLIAQFSALYQKNITSFYALPIFSSNRSATIALFAHSKLFGFKKTNIEILRLFSFFFFSKFEKIETITASNSNYFSINKIFKEVRRPLNTDRRGLDFDLLMNCLSSAFPGGCKCTILWLYNKSEYEAGNELVLRYLSNVRADDLQPSYLDVKKSLTGQSITTKKEIYYGNIYKEKLFKWKDFAEKNNLRQLLVYPLLDSKEEPVGALNFFPHDNFSPNESFSSLLSTFIGAFELVLETYSLFEQFSTLNNILSFNSMADGINSEKEFFERLVNSLKNGDIIGVEGASIFVTTAEKENRLKLIATTGVKPPWKIGDFAYAFGEGLTGCVAESCHTIIENNLSRLIEQKSRNYISKVIEITENLGNNWIGIPIKDPKNNILGVIRCVNKKGGPNCAFPMFTVMDQRILEFLSFISAQLIQNMRIFNKMELALSEKERVLKEQDEFIASISHEILIPIHSILGRLGLLEEYCKSIDVLDQERLDLWFKDIENECFHIRMVSRSYSQSKPQFKRVDIVKEIVVRVKYELERLSKSKHINIYYDLPQERVPLYRVDKNRMIQVMYNLVNNAIKYSNKDTDITIKVEPQEDLSLIIRVSNMGIGIPDNFKDTIFNKYVRTPMAKRYNPTGTGSGLYYCKKIVELDHGGKIWLENLSNPTVFSFMLPRERIV